VSSSPDAPGYSGTPQLRKLGITSGIRLAIVSRPRGWTFEEDLPTDVDVVRSEADGEVDVVLAFVRDPAQLGTLAEWGERVFPSGAIWVAWPRKAAGHVSDVDENAIRHEALAIGLVDVKVAAIDQDWSGLKVVWRKERRSRP
jgi:hypothetical protein